MADDMQTGPPRDALRAKRASIPGGTLDLSGDLPGGSIRRVVKESMLFFWPMASIAEEGRELSSGDLPPRAEELAARRASTGDYTLRGLLILCFTKDAGKSYKPAQIIIPNPQPLQISQW
uniref:Uncharacterized protein n=1 Tax=Branchiostoma floridae TaxID=7739 RepID=C3YUA8_BRAFL|eukprot:XP_002600373.1 hypothetical protein BRAFLDRAFT_66607 [Branchiostoma floridae]